ncbi:MAG: hypothetical protein ACFCUG_13185 [Thiotrichales bacterium]
MEQFSHVDALTHVNYAGGTIFTVPRCLLGAALVLAITGCADHRSQADFSDAL